MMNFLYMVCKNSTFGQNHTDMTFTERVFDIFRQLNGIPRPSHHEEKVADFLCGYASKLGLEYDRDAQNCVVIRKPATPGHENAGTIVLLNHMDMVAVGDGTRTFNPLTDGIESYIDGGFMKARGTSLGADNGIGLSMALAVLASDDIIHGPIEVLTTTNEEDGMTGAAGMSSDFIRGRKVINLDSEDYDTITVGAAGAYLQIATIKTDAEPAPEGMRFYSVTLSGGEGGHSGVDIGKGRVNANHALAELLLENCPDLKISGFYGGSANASIAASATAVIGVPYEMTIGGFESVRSKYSDGEDLKLEINEVPEQQVIADASVLKLIASLPCGVIRMHDSLPGTVMTSNNIGMVRTEGGTITISCHTRSFSDTEMVATAEGISRMFREYGAQVQVMMNTPGWQENSSSDFMKMTDNTFRDVLGFSPRKVAMHFVLEAGYYVQKFPGIEIACIGPRIIEPHSTKERVEISTVHDICRVLVEMLRRLA